MSLMNTKNDGLSLKTKLATIHQSSGLWQNGKLNYFIPVKIGQNLLAGIHAYVKWTCLEQGL